MRSWRGGGGARGFRGKTSRPIYPWELWDWILLYTLNDYSVLLNGWRISSQPTNQIKKKKTTIKSVPCHNVILRLKTHCAIRSWYNSTVLFKETIGYVTLKEVNGCLTSNTITLVLNSRIPHWHIRAEFCFCAKSDESEWNGMEWNGGGRILIRPTNIEFIIREQNSN